MVDKIAADFGELNISVANAGIAQVKALIDVTAEDFKRMMVSYMQFAYLCLCALRKDVNLTGVFNTYVASAKQMKKQGGKEGRIMLVIPELFAISLTLLQWRRFYCRLSSLPNAVTLFCI